MSKRMPFALALVVLTLVVAGSSYGLSHGGERPISAGAAQQAAATWQSEVLWRPTLAEAGDALAEIVNQIDASCWVEVDPVVASSGPAPEGPVYAFAIIWTCSQEMNARTGVAQPGVATWQSAMLWRPTLGEAGEALAELVNQIDASCWVEVDPVVASSGGAPEGSVYAFAVTWACSQGTGASGTTADPAAVVARDVAFAPAQLTIPANSDAAVTLANEGTTPHNFSIDALGVSVDLMPGEETTVTLNVPAGRYDFYCNVPGHRDAGMVGVLVAE